MYSINLKTAIPIAIFGLLHCVNASTMTSKKVATTTTSASTATATAAAANNSSSSSSSSSKPADSSITSGIKGLNKASYYYEWKTNPVFYDKYSDATKKIGFIVALGKSLAGETPAECKMCDRCLKVTSQHDGANKGKSIIVKVVDRCDRCTSEPNVLDLSNVAMNELAGGACKAEQLGVMAVSAELVDCPSDDKLLAQLTVAKSLDEANAKCSK